MIEHPVCPVCGGKSWRSLGKRTYRLADYDRLSPYTQKRFRVLFEVWQPNVDHIELTSRLCAACGFVTYTPRPTAAEIDAKYRFLGALEQDAKVSANSAIAQRRARHLYRRTAKHLPSAGKCRILDFGGSDGRLMREFVARGHECELADYYDKPVPGVTHVATTHEDIPADARYDLIVASHVIEHVAEPLSVVVALKRYLKPRGRLYIEVPMEIWGRAPLHEEPVTHVNFFSPPSLSALLEHANLREIDCTLDEAPHEAGHTTLVIRAVAGLGQPLSRACDWGREAEKYIEPNLKTRLTRYLRTPGRLPGAIAYRLHRGLGR